ncbi:hypothetical protein D6792_01215 [Candidatus Parcubacteria bacterium]|nr:MAG: hypothetical protein D6792_01215 [Candidatus Parcubacteria bacterium]GIW68708.1 MAG: hypothetical protein KatS3mg100_202 [Candidatus Parcubacteria bacterium]
MVRAHKIAHAVVFARASLYAIITASAPHSCPSDGNAAHGVRGLLRKDRLVPALAFADPTGRILRKTGRLLLLQSIRRPKGKVVEFLGFYSVLWGAA